MTTDEAGLVSLSHTHPPNKNHSYSHLGVSKWAGPDGPARQPDKKNMGRVKKFNSPTLYSPARQARWPDGPTRGPKRASPRPVPVN